jgi:hypothetical protein
MRPFHLPCDSNAAIASFLRDVEPKVGDQPEEGGAMVQASGSEVGRKLSDRCALALLRRRYAAAPGWRTGMPAVRWDELSRTAGVFAKQSSHRQRSVCRSGRSTHSGRKAYGSAQKRTASAPFALRVGLPITDI